MVTTNTQTARNRNETATFKQKQEVARVSTQLLAALRELTPELGARSKEIEDGRRVPDDITLRLRRLGLFRTLLPPSLGGLELGLADVVRMIETLAAADSSVGWVAMLGVTAQMLATRAPRALLERIYRDDPDTMMAGAGIPAGHAEKTKGGYRVSGRWPFVSGCQNAQWIVGHCLISKEGQPVISAQGPQSLFILLPAERWRIEDTWHASGLAGTGSHHVVLDNVVVPEEEIFDVLHGPSSVPGALEVTLLPFNTSLHPAVAVGIATGAIADLVAMAKVGRRQIFAVEDLKDSAVFQHEVGRLDAELSAARTLVQVLAEKQWHRALEATLDDKADLIEGLQASAWIHAACTNIVSGCYTLGGSDSNMRSSPLQRRLRDIHAARQHFFAQERFYGFGGRNVLGFSPTSPLFPSR